jgi:hypothetical protein
MTIRDAIVGNLSHLLNKNKFGVNMEIDNWINRHGNEVINSIVLAKHVFLNKTGVDAVGIISPSFKRKNNYDELYHPVMIINNKYVLEKTHSLKVSPFRGLGRGMETMNVNVPKRLTIFELMDNVKKHYGLQNMITYNVSTNNCQHFLLSTLKYNGLLTPEGKQFLKQDTDDAIKGLEPKITPITDTRRIIEPILGFIPNYTNPMNPKPFSAMLNG